MEQTIVIHYIAESAETNMVGDLGNYREEWYYLNDIANALSLASLSP